MLFNSMFWFLCLACATLCSSLRLTVDSIRSRGDTLRSPGVLRRLPRCSASSDGREQLCQPGRPVRVLLTRENAPSTGDNLFFETSVVHEMDEEADMCLLEDGSKVSPSLLLALDSTVALFSAAAEKAVSKVKQLKSSIQFPSVTVPQQPPTASEAEAEQASGKKKTASWKKNAVRWPSERTSLGDVLSSAISSSDVLLPLNLLWMVLFIKLSNSLWMDLLWHLNMSRH